MKTLTFILIIYALLSSCRTPSYEKPSTAKTSINLKNYKGCILVGKEPAFGMPNEPLGAYVYAFRRGDSIWSEIYRYEVMESFRMYDSIK